MTLIFIMTSRRRGHATNKYARGLVFFCDFPAGFPSFSLFVSLFSFSLLLGIYLIFLFWPCLFTETSRAFEKRQGQSRFSELNFSRFFLAFESFWCPSSMCFRTDTMGIQGHGTGHIQNQH